MTDFIRNALSGIASSLSIHPDTDYQDFVPDESEDSIAIAFESVGFSLREALSLVHSEYKQESLSEEETIE